MVGSGWAIDAQTPAVATKKPLAYDAYDYWRSIQGSTLSRDGDWLAYALTSQGGDGELIVRNLRTGAELKHPRGTSPTFTADGKFVVFTIVPTKADDERERLANLRNENQGQGRTQETGEGQNQNQRNQPRNAAGIMTLATGQVSTVERIGSISLPEESSAGRDAPARNGAATGRGGGRGAGGGRAAAPAAGRGQAAAEGAAAATARHALRKDAGTTRRPQPATGEDYDSARSTTRGRKTARGSRTRSRRPRPRKTACSFAR